VISASTFFNDDPCPVRIIENVANGFKQFVGWDRHLWKESMLATHSRTCILCGKRQVAMYLSPTPHWQDEEKPCES
jgi:hypothetical protein